MCGSPKLTAVFPAILSLCLLSARANNECQSENDCVIRYRNIEIPDGRIVEIGCMQRPDVVDDVTAVRKVELDGVDCHKATPDSYGFEFLSNCDQVFELTVKRFNGDPVIKPLTCPNIDGNATMPLKVLRFVNNGFNLIDEESFSNANSTDLQELYFKQNGLLYIDERAFNLRGVHLQLLQIEDEPNLIINEQTLLQHTDVLNLHIANIQRLTAQIFEHLPQTLRNISVYNAKTDTGRVRLANAQQSQFFDAVRIINCALTAFTLDSGVDTRFLNLSGNSITHFEIVNKSVVECLDLSRNNLTAVPEHWLKQLANLRHLTVSGNRLKTISLRQILSAAPSLSIFDMRANQLAALPDDSFNFTIDSNALRVLIDANPWNCLWLLGFAHTHPEKFRIFQYEKYISQINVNGLACQPEQMTSSDTQQQLAKAAPLAGNTTKATGHQHYNVSTYNLPYANINLKRSQRTEAIIIVFLLPVGIFFLFLLLYMWIHCEKMFHLSYYRCPSFLTFKPRQTNANRFDVVRIPPDCGNNVEDCNYEMPLNSPPNACSCKNVGASQKCRKAHHVTYVALPAEQPYKIYEEILEENHDVIPITKPSAATYDHLSFIQPTEEAP